MNPIKRNLRSAVLNVGNMTASPVVRLAKVFEHSIYPMVL